MLFGFTSSFRMGQLLRYSLTVPKRHPDKDVMEYLATEFIDTLRTCLKSGGFARRDNEVEQAGVFLLGYAGRLFRIEGDYQVGELLQPFHACGCGENYAMGAMYATSTIPPRKRIELALQAAEEHSAGVRGPFRIESLDVPPPPAAVTEPR
jgi:hypothetical protein